MKIVADCIICTKNKNILIDQRKSDLPETRVDVMSLPWTSVALDLLGPVMVSAMCNKRAHLKVWPLMLTCFTMGTVQLLVMHDYSRQTFLLKWEYIVSIRGHPMLVSSDQGSQLTSVDNYIAGVKSENPRNWEWDKISEAGARYGTVWEFVPAGSKYKNEFAEARVKATDSSLRHMLDNTIITVKPTINYAELTRVANMINDRPIGVRSLPEEAQQPIMPNMLLLGRTGIMAPDVLQEPEAAGPCRACQEELLKVWKNLWFRQVFPSLLPDNSLKEVEQHENLQPGDICLLKYDNKIKETYHLCRVIEVKPGEDCLVKKHMQPLIHPA